MLPPLRRWQEEAYRNVVERWDEEPSSPTVLAPTGAGKTRLAAELLLMEPDFPAVFLVHRDTLLHQTVKSFRRYGLDAGILANSYNDIRPLTVASIHTLTNQHRLDSYLREYEPVYVIADEAHTSVAPTFAGVFDRLGVKDRRVYSLGLSATLARNDAAELSVLWDEPVYQMTLATGIEEGILVPPRGIAVKISESGRSLLSTTTTTAAFAATASDAFIATDAPRIIADAIRTHGAGRATLGFAGTISNAYALAEACEDIGVRSSVVTATTPQFVREQAFESLARFGRGEDGIHVLWSVDTLGTGTDIPEVSCILLAREIRNRSTFVQYVGRGLRTCPGIGKTDCLVLDASTTHRRFTLDTFYDLGASGDQDERDSSGAGVDTLPRVRPQELLNLGRPEYAEFDFSTPLENQPLGMWLISLGGTMFLPAYSRTVFIVRDDVGFTVGTVDPSPYKKLRAQRVQQGLLLHEAVSLSQEVARTLDAGAPRRFGKPLAISTASASWRLQNEPPSEGQINFLGGISRRLVEMTALHLGVPHDPPPTKAIAGLLLDTSLASLALARLGFDPPLSLR